MSEEKHSPLPWSRDCFLVSEASTPYPSGRGIAHTGGQGRSNEESEANAALIVRSVNALPELVEAAEERLNSGHNDTCQLMLTGEPIYPCNCGHDKLTAALAAAKE